MTRFWACVSQALIKMVDGFAIYRHFQYCYVYVLFTRMHYPHNELSHARFPGESE